MVEEGNASNLAESAKDLALSANKIQKTGPAIVIRPSAAVAVTGDLVLTIPGPDGLSLVAFELEAGGEKDLANLAVMYLVFDPAQGKLVSGVISKTELSIGISQEAGRSSLLRQGALDLSRRRFSKTRDEVL